MKAHELEERLKEILRSYWRQRVALKLFKASSIKFSSVKKVDYKNIPELDSASGYLSQEATQTALDSLEKNLLTRVPKDLFMAQLANFESFLSEALAACGILPSGTLGKLQRSVETHYTISPSDIEKVDEIRERRNTLVHHQGVMDGKYISAASKVISLPWVQDPSTITTIDISPEYLTYVADALVKYARHVMPP